MEVVRAGRAGVADAGAGRQRAEWPELRLCRLPAADPAGRAQRVRELESLARKTGQTQLFIETPYRNAAMLQTLLQTLAPITRLAVSSGLTTPQARTISQTVAMALARTRSRWPDNTTPAVFRDRPLKPRAISESPTDARSAFTAPSPTAAPNRLTSRSATFSRRV
jgi:hypothetical protein